MEERQGLMLDGYQVEFLRMDNAGENLLLASRSKSKDWKMNLKVEYWLEIRLSRTHWLK